jgi:hypothetical protein
MPQTLFTLEALAAKHGDCLLLHWGSASSPRLALIDGGPSGVYTRFLSKRLEALRQARQDPLPLDLAMLSHVDDDHIRGLLDLTSRLENLDANGRALPWEIEDLWFNGFDDVAGNAQAKAFGASFALSAVPSRARHAGATIASVGQGRSLRDRALRLALPVNGGDPLVVGGFTWQLDGGLELAVIAPRKKRIDEFRRAWDKELKKRGWATRTAAAEVAAFLDKSPFNLASIVVLARLGSRTMLLTGDARGDDVEEGLREDGFLTGSSMKVNLLKVPHHGSDRNVDTDFFRTVKADHYVISGNGEHGNPETSTLEMILDARGNERFKIHCTYRNGIKGLKGRMTRLLNKLPSSQRKKFVFRPEPALSLKVDLGSRLRD